MVYYIKAMAKSLTKKAALPIVFAATALTPAMAETTLKIQGPEGDKIAYDQTKEVQLLMTSDDNVSFVDVNVTIPNGLAYKDGSFAISEKLKALGHTFKMNPIEGGFHVTIYNDNLISMGAELDAEAIATFEVTASTKLAGGEQIGLEIVDLTDENADQVAYNNDGPNDNSIASDPISIDKTILPGEWNVYCTAANLADGVLTIDPTQGIFTPQTITVNLKSTVAKIGGLSFRLMLPEGLELVAGTPKLNSVTTGDKSLSYNPIVEGGKTVGYVMFLSGDTKALDLSAEEAVITFDVKADNNLAKAILDPFGANPEFLDNPTFKDNMILNSITVTDIYSTAVKQSDITIQVYNKNEEALWNLLNPENGTLAEVEALANTNPYDHVYDYSKVKTAREKANTDIEAYYEAGELALKTEETATLVNNYNTELEAAKVANEKLYADGVKDYTETLPALLDEKTKQEVAAARAAADQMPEGNAAVYDGGEGEGYRVNIDTNDELKASYDAARAAIEAYGQKIEDLYDQKTEADPEKWDGALLTDSEKGEEASEVAQLKKAAEDAINDFETLQTELNEQNDNNEATYEGDADTLKGQMDALVEKYEADEIDGAENEDQAPELIIADVADEKQAAYDAIENVKTVANEKAEAGLLVDANMPDADVEQAKTDAADAIEAYENEILALEQANDDAYDAFKEAIGDEAAPAEGTLYDALADAKQYVEELANEETGTLAGAYGDDENFPEIKAAETNAEQLIKELEEALETAHDKGGLAWAEGEYGTDAIDVLIDQLNEAIENIKTVADQAKADNDAAYQNGLQDAQSAKDYVEDIKLIADEATAESNAYQEALEAANKAIEAYEDALNASNEKGMVAKDAQNEDSELAKAKDAMDEALQNLETVTENLNDLNDQIDDCEQALQDAKDALQAILDDEKYNYIETSDKTKELIDAINEKIEDLEGRIEDLDKAINEDAEAAALLNENGEVDDWKDALNQILDEIDGTLNAETGELEGGLDQDIENAVAEYDKYHKRGDADMNGRVSVVDYYTILQYVREEKDIETVTAEQLSQLNVVQEEEFGTEIEINITDAIGALDIYLNGGTDAGLDLGERYYSARANEAESLFATTQMVNGVRRIALNLNNVEEYTAAQMDLVLPEGMKLVGAELASRNSGHDLFVGQMKDGRQRIVISSETLATFQGNEGAVLYIDVEGAGEVEFNNVIFSTTKAQGARFTVATAETTGIANVKAATEGEQVYSLSGRVMNALKKGVNIIRRNDGTAQKVIKK